MDYSNNGASDPVALILSKLPDAKRSGNGWACRCPAHDDRRSSLSISTGDDGRALLRCHAGCTTEKICGELGVSISELFVTRPYDSTFNGTHANTAQEPNTVERRAAKAIKATFSSPGEALNELERRHGPRSNSWAYADAEGKTVGLVVRWNLPNGGKDIRPAALIDDCWQLVGMPEPRPLYNLPELGAAGVVYVCEGEKAADAIRSLGLVATTSAHGSQSPHKTDWTPLAGKAVVVLPDNDSAGRAFADDVAAIIAGLSPRSTIKVVELPGLPEKGDAVEWIERFGDAAEPGLMRTELEQLVQATEVFKRADIATSPQHFEPFPIEHLPTPLGSIVQRAAKAIGCDESIVVLPLLSALGAAIGNTRRLLVKQGWLIPPIIWTAIVAKSGSTKSPAIDFSRQFVQQRQKQALRRYKSELESYQIALEEFERQRREYQLGKRETAPDRPVEPHAERFWCDDVTIEAVAALLKSQPRGLLLNRDELAGWFGSFDRYAKGKGGDAARWLECHGGRPLLVDRRGGELIHVESAAVCITGSIQPSALRDKLSREYRQNGLAARMLFAFPPARLKRWTEAEPLQSDLDTLTKVFDRLYGLEFGTDEEGQPTPIVLRMTSEAKALFIGYFNEHNTAASDLSDDLAAAWAKLEEYAARFALIFHHVRWALDVPGAACDMTVDAASMRAGISLARWFANEARRIYAMLDESPADAERRRLADWIAMKGGRATPRTIQQGKRAKTANEAEMKLQDLVEHGYGSWESTPAGRAGQPTRWFVSYGVNKGASIADEITNTVEVEFSDEG